VSGFPDPGSLEYFASRNCLREPIVEMYEAMRLLSEAADAHLAGDRIGAARAILAADIPAIRHWIESLWGRRDLYPSKVHYLRIRDVADLRPSVPVAERIKARQPDVSAAAAILSRFGWHCAFCGIGLIDRRARNLLSREYPHALRWGRTNDERHVAFMCMDNEFDHVLPHSRGGSNEIDNLVPSCAPCNCGKEHWTLGQLGLRDPRERVREKTDWDGLVRLLA
jgi:5-methylcytosine-specific restriction endonuclease McrA